MESNDTIEKLINKSNKFRSDLIGSFENYSRPINPKSTLISNTFGIVLEHHVSLHLLSSNSLMTTAMSVARMHYDAIVRLAWITFAATELDIQNLSADLTKENAQTDRSIAPETYKMLAALDKSEAHPPLIFHLKQFKAYSSNTLNSFVHTGYQAIGFQKIRFPTEITSRVIKQSNNLLHMAAAVFSEQYEDLYLTTTIFDLAKSYEDCFQFRDSDPA